MYDPNAPLTAYEAQMQEAERRESEAAVGSLAPALMAEFEDARNRRALVELRWLQDLRQYKGIYSEKETERMRKRGRSQVYYRLTTTKVNTMVARLMDLLFPQRSKNWTLENTPDPELPESAVMTELGAEISAAAQSILAENMANLAAQNIVPDQLAMMRMQNEALQAARGQIVTPAVVRSIAEKRAQDMETVIDDQLKECDVNGQRRASWQTNCKSVIKSACIYGMGVLKGPLVEEISTKRFVPRQSPDGKFTDWQEQENGKSLRPYHEAVSIWDIFPDPVARNSGEVRFVWQTHLYTDKDLLDMSRFPGVKGDVVRDHLRVNRDGDASHETWETHLQTMDESGNGPSDLKKRYRVYERWGFLSGRELSEAGLPVAEQDMENVYSSNVLILGGRIVKAAVNPLEGVDIPYFFYPFQQDDSSFWPEGIASMCRGLQAGANVAVRAMLDNAAASSGPLSAVNVCHLAAGEDPLAMVSNRVVLIDKPDKKIGDVFQSSVIPSCIEHNLTMMKAFQDLTDEVTTPRFNAGDGNIKGAGETASGLSMLMGASNIILKDHVKDFDEHIVAPFIRAMFRWNMRWNPREDIKGDYEVVAVGSQSLIAKEVRAQQIPAIISYLNHPAFAPYIKPKDLLDVSMEQTDLPAERIIRSEEEALRYQQEQALIQAQAQVQAFAQELEKRGADPAQIQQQLVAMMAQAQAQAQQAESPRQEMMQ